MRERSCNACLVNFCGHRNIHGECFSVPLPPGVWCLALGGGGRSRLGLQWSLGIQPDMTLAWGWSSTTVLNPFSQVKHCRWVLRCRAIGTCSKPLSGLARGTGLGLRPWFSSLFRGPTLQSLLFPNHSVTFPDIRPEKNTGQRERGVQLQRDVFPLSLPWRGACVQLPLSLATTTPFWPSISHNLASASLPGD